MATYTGIGRTEPFEVKDVTALETALEMFDIKVNNFNHSRFHKPNTVELITRTVDGQWEFTDHGAEIDDDEDAAHVSIPELVAPHLVSGEIAYFQHVGSEKARYLCGYAIAVHSDGRIVRLDLDDIRSAAAAMAGSPSIKAVP